MTAMIHLAVLFVAKMLDNALSTAKTILIQRNRCFLAGIALILSNYIYFCITKNIVTSESNLAIKERTYVNVIMSDDLEAMRQLRDFLAEHHITNVAADSYTLDWNTKTITITAYAETKKESMLINRYIDESPLKFKRVVQKG